MDKFKISQLRDYFLKTNDTNVSFKDLSKEDLLGLALMSIFDKKGETISGEKYSYERPDGIIDENEFNITRKEYEKAIKQIYKQLKKETDNEISAVKMPSYDDLQAMMENDKKVDINEIKLFASKGVIKKESAEKPEPVLVPAKTGTNELSYDEKMAFIDNAMINHETEVYRILDAIEAAEANGTTAFNFTGLTDEVQNTIDEFEPDNDAAFNLQDGLDGKQFNENGQMITRINNHAGFYEKYKYDNPETQEYSEMMRYKGNGYKAEYWRRETLTDRDGKTFEGKVQYILDEKENVYKIVLPPNAQPIQLITDFNDFMLYDRVMRYDQDIYKTGE